MQPSRLNPTHDSQDDDRQRGGMVSEILDRLEVRAGKIGMNTPEQSLDFLRGLDEAKEKIDRLEGTTSRKISESQFSDITARLRTEIRGFLRDIGGAAALRSAREVRQPPEENWWWYLDELHGKARKAGARRLGLSVLGMAFGLLLAVLVYNQFLAPDPITVARYQAETLARDYMMNGDLASAMEQVEIGLSAVPDDPVLLSMKSVLLEEQGQDSEAQQARAEVERNAESREDFFHMFGNAYLNMGNYEKAVAAAENMLVENPESAPAYMLLGQTYELTGLYSKAFDTYALAYDHADAQDQIQLAGLARVKMAMLLQMMNSPNLPTQEVTPPLEN